jgi:predicted RND superfamily exporter protein
MLEYVVTFLMCIGVLVMVLLLYYVFKEFGGRVIDLAASEYP